MASDPRQATNRMEQVREKNVSERKLGFVRNASFDTIVAALKTKSENAQSKFIFMLFRELSGEVLAAAYKYAEKEIKRRVTNVKPLQAA
jgi:hypothetical protein